MAMIVWQGISVDVPPRWSPIKLEGDFNQGYALLADLHRPRLGIRWRLPRRKKIDVAKILRKRMLEEVGQLAADEAEPIAIGGDWEAGLIYIEPEPPGRDIWMGRNKATGRFVEIIHHAHRRERILRDHILPSVQDVSGNETVPWSVFDLSCKIPRDLKLYTQKLNAGDLTLTFTGKKRKVRVRQVAVAELALQRRPLEKWLLLEQRLERKQYRRAGEPAEILFAAAGRELTGFSSPLQRRRRFFFAKSLPRQVLSLALLDAARDRLVLVQGTDDDLVRTTAESVGWNWHGASVAQPQIETRDG